MNIRSSLSSESLTKIGTLNTDLMEALQFEVRNRLKAPSGNNDDADAHVMLGKINGLIGQLGQIAHMHAQHIQFYKHHKYKMKLPALLSEIYEIENGPSSPVVSGNGGVRAISCFANDDASSMMNHQQLPGLANGGGLSYIKKESANFIRFESSNAIINAM
jgi:hypothetical protein